MTMTATELKPLPTPGALAARFVAVLKEWLTADEWSEMCEANAAEESESICHSHDFCDANMAMDEVMSDLGLTDEQRELRWGADWLNNDESIGLWNEAWALAMPSLGKKPQERLL